MYGGNVEESSARGPVWSSGQVDKRSALVEVDLVPFTRDLNRKKWDKASAQTITPTEFKVIFSSLYGPIRGVESNELGHIVCSKGSNEVPGILFFWSL
ncbi:hypothetical protein RRG08_034284 [Elysia crispata]|uniref:Uncharacterized protein n=1 Tax=Elysia crispata TaxID=231223 RepID=A0AAE1DQ68_9GAST|nr:hypothetical protein RRG08_034284 [Elysia crispata]